MAVKIRLKRMGAKRAPYYRIVAADSRAPRDGRFIEQLGTYDPTKNPAVVTIKEEEIFVNPNNKLYRYYQLCPHCGFIVNIPKEILSDGIKQRIEERCSKDDKLFRKMFLYSELFSLDKTSTEGQKKLLKK